MSRRTSWSPLGLALLAAVMLMALGLRLWLFGRMEMPPLGGDALNYRIMVDQLLRDGVYGYMSTQSNAYVTPGYPLFLAAIFGLGGSEQTVRIIQALLGALTLLPLASLAHGLASGRTEGRASGPSRTGEWAGLLTALLLALYPAWLRAPAHLLTEVLFTFLFSGYLWIQWRAIQGRNWERPLWPLLAGLSLGLAVLVRPVLFPLLPLPWLYLMWHERSLRPWRAALWAGAGFLLVLLPWWIRNLLVLGKLILFATQTGNPILGGMDPYDLWQGKLWSGVGPDTGDQMKRAGEIFLWLMKNHPLLTLRWFTIGKFSRIFLTPWLGWEFPTLQHIHTLLIPLGWLGALAAIIRRRPELPLSLLLLVLTGLQLAFIPESRYAYSLIGPLAILASLSLLRIFAGGDHRGRGPDPDPGL